jgi:ABC-2 type transport system ATP-binding protein
MHQETTVFLSSHLLADVEQMATHVGIVRDGELVFEGELEELRRSHCSRLVLEVDRPIDARMTLEHGGWTVERANQRRVEVRIGSDADVPLIARQVIAAGVGLFHLSVDKPTLEELFLDLTSRGTRRVEKGAATMEVS